MKAIKRVITLCLILATLSLHAQDWKELGVDAIFSMARKEVFDGNRAAGQKKLRFILQQSPGYDEARIFLARTYAWDGLYEDSRNELRTVLETNANHHDALDALIEVELWNDRYDKALGLANQGLIIYPNDEGFLYKCAMAQNSLGHKKEALLTLSKLLQIDPAHEDGMALYKRISLGNLKYTVVASYGADLFSKYFDPAHYLSTQLSRTNSWGSSHIRLNYASRFDTHGSQFEIDMYPTVMKGVYAYLSYGYSSSVLFPENRAGAELFFKLPDSFETSAGIRYMDFGSGTRIMIYTGSLGWYFKNYWLSLRPYITPDAETGTSVSAKVYVRRYFTDAENYIGLKAGLGFSPDSRTIQNSTGLSENEIYLLRSQNAGVTWRQVFKTTWSIGLSVDVARQELSFDQGSYVIITSSSVSVRKKI